MSADDIPIWAALPVSALLLLGAALALVGSLGLLRLGRFYERLHAPTLGTTLGIGCVLLASALFFSVAQTRPVLHEILIAVLVAVTTPVTLMLLARAALHRDRQESNDGVPPPFRDRRPEGRGARSGTSGAASRPHEKEW